MANDKVERSIFKKYRKILIAVLVFIGVDSFVIAFNFYGTFKANEAAVSINLSGRQRMLSQRTTKALLLLQRSVDNKDEAGIATDLKELELAVNLFDTTLKGFRDGDTVTGGDGNPVFLTQVETAKSKEIVENAYGLWDPYLKRLEPLRKGNRNFTHEQLEAAVQYAQKNNLAILKLMNDLTSDLEQVANARAGFLRWVLLGGFLAALANFAYTVFVSMSDLVAKDEAVAKAQSETAEILATVHEGLFLVDKNKRLGSQFSASLSQMLHTPVEAGMELMPVLQRMVSPDLFEAANDYIELLLGERVKEALVASLNPLVDIPATLTDAAGRQQERYLSFFFNRVMEDEKVSHLLVTVQDVTEKVSMMRELETSKTRTRSEMETLLRLLSKDFPALQQFVQNVGNGLKQINEKLSTVEEDGRDRLHTLNYVLRTIHTIKGEAAMLGIDVLENYAHACEQEMVAMRESETGITGDNILRVAVLLEGFYDRYSSLAEIVQQFDKSLGDVAPTASVASPSQPLVTHFTQLAERIARDSQKEVEVSCQLEKLSTLPAPVAQLLQSVAIQLVRNAMTHGLEPPAERQRLGKPEKGSLSIWCDYFGNGQYEFTVRDDGRGIVPDRLRASLVKNGVLTEAEAARLSDVEVAHYIFQPGVSTAQTANRDAGHGVGLDIVLAKVNSINGRLLVKSQPDQFTEFRIRFSV